MNYNDFIKKHNGKGTDYDGRYGVQCVDLVKAYLKEVFSITAGYWGDAHAYYDGFNSHKELTTNFTRIANTPDFIPKKGDIVVWSSKLNNGPGHIAIANVHMTKTGLANTINAHLLSTIIIVYLEYLDQKTSQKS